MYTEYLCMCYYLTVSSLGSLLRLAGPGHVAWLAVEASAKRSTFSCKLFSIRTTVVVSPEVSSALPLLPGRVVPDWGVVVDEWPAVPECGDGVISCSGTVDAVRPCRSSRARESWAAGVMAGGEVFRLVKRGRQVLSGRDRSREGLPLGVLVLLRGVGTVNAAMIPWLVVQLRATRVYM